MKSYTDLEQSKKLAEFLPLESADMYWWPTSIRYYIEAMDDGDFNEEEGHIRAWSLAALLEQIPSDLLGSNTLTIEKDDSEDLKYGLNYHDRWGREDAIQTKYYDNLVDACYEMILKLHELKIL